MLQRVVTNRACELGRGVFDFTAADNVTCVVVTQVQ